MLIAFFYVEPKDDDLCYSHFPPEHGKTFEPRNIPDLKGLRKNLNKRVAHFTATRLALQPDVQYYLDKGGEIDEVLTTFIDSLDPQMKAAFTSRLQQFESRDIPFLQSGRLPSHFIGA